MQSRVLRVPEVCFNHTSSSCLVAFPFSILEYRVFYTLVLPDPWLTQEGPVTSPVSALYPLFVRSCDLAHDGLHCSHVCANTHRSLLLHLSLELAFVFLCSQMDEHQNVRPSTGTTELNHSYYAGNSLSALHSSQQFHDDTVSTSVHPLVSTQETNGTSVLRLCVWSTVTTRPHQLNCSCGPHSQRQRRRYANFARRGRHAALIP